MSAEQVIGGLCGQRAILGVWACAREDTDIVIHHYFETGHKEVYLVVGDRGAPVEDVLDLHMKLSSLARKLGEDVVFIETWNVANGGKDRTRGPKILTAQGVVAARA